MHQPKWFWTSVLAVCSCVLSPTAIAVENEQWISSITINRGALQTSLPQEPSVTVLKHDISGIDLSIQVPGVSLKSYESDAGMWVLADWPNAQFAGEPGTPTIPVIRRLFIAPPGAEVRVDTDISQVKMYDLAKLGYRDPFIPVQPLISMENDEPEQVAFEYNPTAYTKTDSWITSHVEIIPAGMFRGQQLYLLEVHPLLYNPIHGSFSLTSTFDINIHFQGGQGEFIGMGPYRNAGSALLNPPASGRGTGNYLILVADDYENAASLATFVSFKESLGYTVSTHTVVGGTSNTALKSYIEGLWGTSEAPDYILIVGDTNTVPHWVGQGNKHGDTDLYYACMDAGDDWYPDIAIGRFAIRSETQLDRIIEKSMHVETGAFSDPTYIKRAGFVAGSDSSSGDHGAHDTCIDDFLDPNGYNCIKLYERGYNADTQDVKDAMNWGCMFLVYFGHSSSSGWWGPDGGFYQNDVRALSNDGLYGLVFGFSCNTAHYTYDECLGETWIREEDKGSAAFLSASTYIYYTTPPWHEAAFLEVSFMESIIQDEITEVSPAWQDACMKLLAEYGASYPVTRDYFEMFVLLGDPALDLPMEEAPSFALVIDPESTSVCAPEEAEYTVEVTPILGYSDPVTLSASGNPPGTTVSFSVNPVTPGGTSVMTIGNTANGTPGYYSIEVMGDGPPAEHKSTFVSLDLSTQLPGDATLVSPVDDAIDVPLMPTFEWDPAIQGAEYRVQVAENPSFTSGLYWGWWVTDTHYTFGGDFDQSKKYYWRVWVRNGCGEIISGEVFSFTTVGVLTPDTYDLLNGESGTYTYYDDHYNGQGNNNVPLEPLYDGKGDLTNAAYATGHWNANPLEYVGWGSIDPTITFFFEDEVNVTAVTLYLDDDGGGGGVHAPTDVTFEMGSDTIVRAVTDPPGDAPFVATFDNLNLTGDPLDITLADYGSGYMMLSEVVIFGSRVCPADVNEDSQVNIDDIFSVLGYWGNCPSPCPPYCGGDVNEDCIVNIDDIFTILGEWGPCTE